jgi:DNA-binding phage protein
MDIVKKFFPEIMQDNDMVYFARLEGMIDSIDELSSLQITKNSNSYQFRLAPSHPKYIEMLLDEVLKFHNIYGIRLNLSKSIKTTGTISFEIIL